VAAARAVLDQLRRLSGCHEGVWWSVGRDGKSAVASTATVLLRSHLREHQEMPHHSFTPENDNHALDFLKLRLILTSTLRSVTLSPAGWQRPTSGEHHSVTGWARNEP
jgi:hypothetical protein